MGRVDDVVAGGDELPPLMNKRELAALLRVSVRTVERRIALGLPCVRVGRQVRFRRADVTKLLSRGLPY